MSLSRQRDLGYATMTYRIRTVSMKKVCIRKDERTRRWDDEPTSMEGYWAIVVDVFWTIWPGTVDGYKAIAGIFAQAGFEADFARPVAY